LESHLAIVQGVFDDNCHRRDENTKLMKARLAECEAEVVLYGEERAKMYKHILTFTPF